jgi:hypothetical protein
MVEDNNELSIKIISLESGRVRIDRIDKMIFSQSVDRVTTRVSLSGDRQVSMVR